MWGGWKENLKKFKRNLYEMNSRQLWEKCVVIEKSCVEVR